MEKLKQIVQELYLYNNKIEMAIKVSIWIISWIGGILTIHNKESIDALESAYFIFSLSLLMEFVPQINSKYNFFSKLIHTAFCIIIFFIFFLSIFLLLGGISNNIYNIMFYLSKIVIIYMSINCLILWLSNDKKINANFNINTNKLFEQKKKAFKTTLFSGNLGSIDKGEKNE